MPVIDHLDIPTKRIYLASGTTSYHPTDDLYKEVRALRRTDDTLRVVTPPLTASGNVDKGGGKKTPRLVRYNNGWRVVPADESHVLNVTGEQITDDGQSGPACFDLSTLSPTSKVIIHYEPAAAEVIVVETGGGGGGPSAAQIADAVWDEPAAGHLASGSTGQLASRLDAAISTRAQPGDEMGLTSTERDDLSFRIWDEPLSAHTVSLGTSGHELGHVHDASIVRHGSVLAGSTARDIATTITGPPNIYAGLSIMVRGTTERDARVVRYFDGITGVFSVTIPFAFVPQAGDSIFVLSQRHTSAFGALR